MNVYIVDDNATNLLLFRHMLNQLDEVDAVTFESPVNGLAACKESVPDLVLLDYMMPEMSGIEFLKAFRKLSACRDVPVIVVTADIDRNVRYEALQEGANDFLSKPVDKTEFTARVKNMLALRKSQKQLANRAEWLASEVHKATREIRERELEAVFLLSKAAEYRDPETGAHILRMAHYSRLIGRALGLSSEEQNLLLEAAPMHDIGKVATPDRILLKPGKLDEEEFVIMKQHAEYGYQILKSSKSQLFQMAAEIALTHHEKYNGQGYPQGLAGENIPLVGRIVAVADVFDALTSERPYKKAWSFEDAIALLQKDAGVHFDPRCVDALLAHMDEVAEIRRRFQDDGQTANLSGGSADHAASHYMSGLI